MENVKIYKGPTFFCAGAYIKIYKSHRPYLCAISTISDILTFQFVYVQNVGQGHEVQFS